MFNLPEKFEFPQIYRRNCIPQILPPADKRYGSTISNDNGDTQEDEKWESENSARGRYVDNDLCPDKISKVQYNKL